MSRFSTIYAHHADRYDALVNVEDYRRNLAKFLSDLMCWKGLRVYEAGVGTGRVTKLYIDHVLCAYCSDRSSHMLDFARTALSAFQHKIDFIVADNNALPVIDEGVDVFIEGWSFGHPVSDCNDHHSVKTVTANLVTQATKNVRSGGRVIIIETLGTNCDSPRPPSSNLIMFYDELERQHGFHRTAIRTDYLFNSVDDAALLTGFFFGSSMGDVVRASNRRVVPEWTGIWTLSV